MKPDIQRTLARRAILALSGCTALLLSLLLMPATIQTASATPQVADCGACAGVADAFGVNPTAGVVGTLLQVGSNYQQSAATTYRLGYVTSQPPASGCVSPHMLNSVPAFKMEPTQQAGALTANFYFHWPLTLGVGKYWLCAVPQTGPGSPLFLTQPFTVTAGAAPTPQLQVPVTYARPGDTLPFTVKNWNPADGQAPALALSPADQSRPVIDLKTIATQTSHPDPDTYAYNLPISKEIGPGFYTVVVTGDCKAAVCAINLKSAQLQILSAQPTATPNSGAAGGISGILSSLSPVVLIGVPATLLTLALIIMPFALSRRRARARAAAQRRGQYASARSYQSRTDTWQDDDSPQRQRTYSQRDRRPSTTRRSDAWGDDRW